MEGNIDALGHFSTQCRYGVRGLPIFSEMRAICSGFNIQLLQRSISRSRSGNLTIVPMGYLDIPLFLKLFSIGVEGRILAGMPPKEEEAKRLKQLLLEQEADDSMFGEFVDKIGDKLTSLMMCRHTVDKQLEASEDSKEEEDKKEQSLAPIDGSLQQSDQIFIAECSVCSLPCTPEDVNPFGIACHFGSNNFISQICSTKETQKKIDETSITSQDQKKTFPSGQFYLKPSSHIVHYHCLTSLSQKDLRVFAIDGSHFNCVIPLPSECDTPSPKEYEDFKDPTKFYFQPHPSLQFIATLLQNYNHINQQPHSISLEKGYAFPLQVKNSLPKLPLIVGEFVSDNVALAVRLRGLLSFLRECLNSCSPTLVCIENMKSVFHFFQRSPSLYQDEAVCSPTPANFLQYRQKIERYFGNLVVWKDQMDKEATRRIKDLFSLYAQLLVEIKMEAGHPPELSRSDLLPLVEMASALILSRYKLASLSHFIKQLDTLQGYSYFDYLWEDVLGMNPLVLGVFSNKAAIAAQACPILSHQTHKTEVKMLRSLLLSFHPLKLKFIALPPDFVQFQILYYQKKCSHCGAVPKRPAVCGLCGEVVCDDVWKPKECKYHSLFCGYGTGVFLSIESGEVQIEMASSRAEVHLLPTPYRTELGEHANNSRVFCTLSEAVLSAIESKLVSLSAHLA